MKRQGKAALLLGCAAIGAVMMPRLAMAQANAAPPAKPAADVPAGSAMEAVVVTARKRQEKLFDVPGPVSAVSSRQIERLRLRNARDYLRLIPSAYLDEGDSSGTARNFSLRGITTPNLFGEPGVGLYLDDVFSNGFISYPTQLHDIDRIEVLRGPQGALYGRDAVGGVVNIVSHNPTQKYEGSFTATYASHNRVELDAMANLPVSDKIGVRLSAWGVNQPDGEFYNKTLHQYIDANNDAGGRAVAVIDPTESLQIKLIVEHTQGDTAGTYVYFPTIETRDSIERDTQPTNSYSATRYAASARYDSAIGQFTLIVGGREYSLDGVEDTDLSTGTTLGSGAGGFGKEVLTRTNAISSKSVEARFLSHDIGPFTIMAGMNYLDEAATGTIATDLVTLTDTFHKPYYINIANNQSLQSYAGYLELTWHITQTLSLIADGRFTSDSKTGDLVFDSSPSLQGLYPSASASPKKTFDRFSPGGTLAWTPAPDWRVYGKIQTGFRAGGFNYNVASIDDLPYNEETSVNYEVGAKHQFWGGRALLAGTAYLLEQSNVLVAAYDGRQPGPLASFQLNAGQARTYGLEGEGSVQIAPGLQLAAALAYTDGQFTSGGPIPRLYIPDLSGQPLTGARKWTGSVSADYRTQITDRTAWLANISYSYRSPAPVYVGSRDLFYDAVDLINLSSGVQMGRYELRGFIENLLDKHYRIAYAGLRTNSAGQSIEGIETAPGRSFGLTASVRF